MAKNEENWMANYEALKQWTLEHGHFPNRAKIEGRGFLNWYKYNAKLIKQGMLKVVKAGETVVDLNKPVGNDDDNSSGGGSTPSGGGSTNTGGSSTNRQYTLNVSSANTAQGTVSGGGTYSEGSRVNIKATPASGYAFDKWSDGNTQATRTINVTQNMSLTAQFKAVDNGNTEPGGEGDDISYL